LKAAGRAGHLVARHAGSRNGKRLLLIAHLDTVFELDSPFQHWVADARFAHGPGAGDDKGGIAVIVAALRAMQAAGTLKQANITVFLTGDEEDAGSPLSISRRDLVAEAKKADAALDFEDLAQEDGPGGPLDMGSTARRSAGSWTVTVTGRSAHSAGVGAGNYGAIYELARILDEFRHELPEDKLTYNVGLIGGGQTAALDAGRIRIEATGKTNIEIAYELRLSLNTVKVRLKQAFDRLGVVNRTELANVLRAEAPPDDVPPGITRLGPVTLTRQTRG